MKKKLILGLVLAAALIAAGVLFVKNAYVVPVLMYHAIDSEDQVTKLSVSPEGFRRQMEFLYKHHYNVVPLEKIVSYLRGDEKIPPRTGTRRFFSGSAGSILI